MDKSLHIFFSGTVQGVGFRFTAKHLADRYRVKGWVKNKTDGKVELIAQGSKDKVYTFLNCLNEEFRNHIIDSKIEDTTDSQDHKDFQIRF